MEELSITPALVGEKVQLPARPEWGVGQVLRVQTTRENGVVIHRVSVQFAVGSRTLVVPPARLCAPRPEPQRQESGWLDTLARSTLDDRLRALPESVTDLLGGPGERLRATFPLYELRDDAASLMKWARAQSGVGDPLAHWSRDELTSAFADFRIARDAHLKNVAAKLLQQQGIDAIRELLADQPDRVRAGVAEALGRVIPARPARE